jgi:hypothetical protein
MAKQDELAASAELLRSQMQALLLRLQLIQGDVQAMAAQLHQAHAAVGALAAAPAAAPEPELDEATRAALDVIATLPMDQLPSYVTRQAQNDDGSPKRDAAGLVILLHQDGTPLSVIERAYVARAEQLRQHAGG